MKKTIYLISISLLIVFVTHSCEKVEDSKDTLSAEESTVAANLFDDVFKQIDYAAKLFLSEPTGEKSNILSMAEGCGSISIEPIGLEFPKTITIDFGSSNCTGVDLRSRRGKILAQITDWYRDEGCTISITTDNYFVDDYQVEGTKTIVNSGKNMSENMTFTVKVENGLITDPEGNQFTWNTNRMNEWIEGEDTQINILDDVYEITGTANGLTSKQKEYTITITKALNVAVNCPWIRSGTIDISADPANITVDYGTGECDAEATVTILGQAIPIVMR